MASLAKSNERERVPCAQVLVNSVLGGFTGCDARTRASATLSEDGPSPSHPEEVRIPVTDVEAQRARDTQPLHVLQFGPWRVYVFDRFVDDIRALAAATDFAHRGDVRVLGVSSDVASGRSRNVSIELPDRAESLELRPLHHGGILAPITGDRFSSLARPLHELRLSAELVGRGAPVAVPAFVVGRRRAGFWRAAFASVRLPDARDGVAYLDASPSPRSLERAARAAGAAIRRFHDLGACHADLHIKNLLIQESPDQSQVTLIDLDRAKLVERVGEGRRIRELMRLRRSLIKRGYARALAPEVSRAFTDAYVAGDPVLRDHLLASNQVERLRGRAHTLFYRAP